MRRLSIILSVLVLIGWACTPKAPETKQPEPAFDLMLTQAEKDGGVLTPEILWKFRRISDPQLSPDGKNVLFGVSEYDVPTNKSRTSIYLIPFEGGEPKKLLNTSGAQFNQRWLNNETFAFIGTHEDAAQVYKANINNPNPEKVTQIEGGINSFEFSNDGKMLLYTKEVKVTKDISDKHTDLPLANVYAADDLMYRHWNHWNDASFSHIFYASYTGSVITDATDIMKNEAWDAPLSPYFDNTEMTWSPDGKTIAYTCKKLYGKDAAVSTNSDVFLYNTETGETKNITEENKGYDKYPVYSNDGKYIAYLSMERDG